LERSDMTEVPRAAELRGPAIKGIRSKGREAPRAAALIFAATFHTLLQ